MKAVLKFDLEDPEDAKAHLRAIKSVDVLLAISDFKDFLRHEIKYMDHTEPQSVYDTLEAVRNKLLDFFEERSINIEELL